MRRRLQMIVPAQRWVTISLSSNNARPSEGSLQISWAGRDEFLRLNQVYSTARRSPQEYDRQSIAVSVSGTVAPTEVCIRGAAR